ncbi:MAG: hypothetical protein KBS81_03970 [Spirochaetales bacterium]|nr:hypothetical protein [Candidatus Physcosoma equi]
MKTDFKTWVKEEIVFCVSFLAAVFALILTPPAVERFFALDWKTLFSLFMLLLTLEGLKKENMFLPFMRLTTGFQSVMALTYFLVAVVFFLAAYITNDVSLVTFVPLTIAIFRFIGKEQYTVKVVVLENIAAITGAFLTPFGNPQNLYIYANTEIGPMAFVLHMMPLWFAALCGLAVAIRIVYRKNPKERIYVHKEIEGEWDPARKGLRVFYVALLALVLFTIISGKFNFISIVCFVLIALLVFDRSVYGKVDYILLATFFCFFVFSSSIAANPKISAVLSKYVAGNEYWWGILVSQIVSNVPGTALLHPFTENMTALLYGVNTAGMGDLVGSLACLISFRLYTQAYPTEKGRFLKYFHLFSTCFLVLLIVVAVPLKNWAI